MQLPGLLLLALAAPLTAADTATGLSEQLRQISLDPELCLRVRDLTFQREDARVYFTDGLLMFAKPVGGRRVMAVYSAAEAGDDAEVLLRPPDKSERASLAKSTGQPNLNEHFHTALLLFSDGGGEELLALARQAGAKAAADEGVVLAGRYNETVRNFASSFVSRLVLDLLVGEPRQGLFYGAFSGRKLGNFDLMYDPIQPEQIVLGQVSSVEAGRFDVWTSFRSRSGRQGGERPADAVQVDDYRIDVELMAGLELEVKARVKATARRRVAGAIGFELAPQLEVKAARVDGKAVEVFRRESLRSNLIGQRSNEPFLIVLAEPLEQGSVHEIEFDYGGQLIRPAGNNVYFVSARTNWYPSRGYHFAKFDMTFRGPKELRVVATGDIVEERLEGERRVTRRATSAPVRLAGFNVGDYESVTLERAGLKIEVCANRQVETALAPRAQQTVVIPPAWVSRGARRPGEFVTMPAAPAPDPKARLNELGQEIASAMDWMSQRFGAPPLPRVTVSPIPGSFGQGFPGLVYLSTISYLDARERPAALQSERQVTFYSELLHAHELAHQWWGNIVTAESYRDEWLQEALANYTALMSLERKKGARGLETTLGEYKDELLGQSPGGGRMEAVGPITWGLRLRAEGGVDPWRVIIYDKGSWILHMLRRRCGDERFLAMLGEMRKRYSYRTITTEQFRDLAAGFLPKGDPDPTLEVFFDAWVYSTGVPQLTLTSKVRGKAPAVEVVVTLGQSGVGDDFSADVPVEIRVPGQAKPVVRWMRTGPEAAVVTMKLKAAPLKVELAPGAAVLMTGR